VALLNGSNAPTPLDGAATRSAAPTTKSFWAFALLALLALGLSLVYSPFVLGVGHDREVFRYMGMLMHNGGVPYRDAFDHKPPGIYFLAYLGHGLGPWGLWAAMLLLVELAALFFYQALRKLLTQGQVLLAVLFLFLIRYAPTLNGGQLTREATACLVLVQLSLFVISSKPGSFFFQGVLSSLIFLTQQNEVLATAPVVLFGLYSAGRDLRTRLLNLAVYAGGALAAGALVLGYFAAHGAVREFVQCAFLFNFQHFIPSEAGSGGKLTTVFKTLLSPLLLPYTILLFAGIAGLLIWGRKRTAPGLAWVLLASGALEFFSISISGRNEHHYYLGLVPYLMFLLLYAWNAAPVAYRAAVRLGLGAACGLFLLGICGYLYVRAAHKLEPYRMPAWASELSSVSGQRGQLLVARKSGYLALNTDLNIVAPTKWIFTFIWDQIPDWDPNGAIFRQMLEDIRRQRCRYIVDFSPGNPFSRVELQNLWDRFIQEHYERIGEDPADGMKLYRWKQGG
jgi:hypothetical protein